MYDTVTHKPLYTAVFQIQAATGATHSLEIDIKCPICGNPHVTKNGTRPASGHRDQNFECLDPMCPAFHPSYPRHGKQFIAKTSKVMTDLIAEEIRTIYDNLYCHGVLGTTEARNHHMSDAWISFLRAAFDAAITQGVARDQFLQQFQLVLTPTKDQAVSIDETFFKIKNITIYLIIVRGYLSRKVLAVVVSYSRKEADMHAAFEEAQRNCKQPIQIVTADAWGATEVMIRHLNRPITLVMHRHKKPYEKAVIERIEYEPEKNLRRITQIGVPTDIFCKRGERDIHYLVKEEPIQDPAKKPRGRPKGSKKKVIPPVPISASIDASVQPIPLAPNATVISPAATTPSAVTATTDLKKKDAQDIFGSSKSGNGHGSRWIPIARKFEVQLPSRPRSNKD